MSLITVIGRGHSGTRLISHTLYASGVYMGRLINASGDKMPPDALYDACRVMAKYVRWNGGLSWDFDALHTVDIDPEFTHLVKTYLHDVLPPRSRYENCGWKLPETTLVYPWIVRMFPDAKYIHWVRDPRDCILRRHKTDDLRDFDIQYPQTDDARERRAISWLYQYEIMKATPTPEHCITVRFEDAILNQDETFARVEAFLGFPLGKVIVRPDSVGRWKTDDGVCDFEFLHPAMKAYGYI